MRKNTQTVLEAWLNDRRGGKQGSAIWTDGDTIWSYATVILAPPSELGLPWVLNVTPYSVTTSTHQNSVRLFLGQQNVAYTEVDGLERGATVRDLVTTVGQPWPQSLVTRHVKARPRRSEAPAIVRVERPAPVTLHEPEWPVTWTGLGAGRS